MNVKPLIFCLLLALSCRPQEPCKITDPIPPPQDNILGGGLDGFDSPYIGQFGSWDGKGGELGGSPKTPLLDQQVSLGMRWTFMTVYWRQMEPDAPVDLTVNIPPEWQELDDFVIDAHNHGLNILMQPVIGGNGKGPPDWAGTRQRGSSAPRDMDGLVNFVGKLVERYQPGGVLAQEQGFTDGYGIRAWEMDNEPGTYRNFDWNEQTGDYAEFFTKSAARIKELDPLAIVLGPAIASGDVDFVRETLDASQLIGSPTYVANGQRFSIGPSMDVVSFHIYEGFDRDCVECVFQEVRGIVESFETQPGFEFARKQEYWHTEGNYQFLKLIREKLRANWRWQFMTRTFAAGIRKLTIKDPGDKQELESIRKYIELFPDPFPMLDASDELGLSPEVSFAFRHPNNTSGNLWVVWAANGEKDTSIRLPITAASASVIDVDGTEVTLNATEGFISIDLKGAKISPPRIVIDAGL